MKKKELKKMRVLKATKKMIAMAKADEYRHRKSVPYAYYDNSRKGYQYGLYMRCMVSGSVLKVAFFLPEHLKMDGRLPAYELYIDKEEGSFLTYNRLEGKWLTAKLDMIDWPMAVSYSEKKWISGNWDRFIKKFLKVEHGGYRGLLEYQLRIRAEQLKQRYKKETEPWDLDMAQTPGFPKDWEKWVSKVGIAEHFIFYRYSRKGADTGYCTYCEKEVSIRKPRHNKAGTCSCCRHKITFKSEGKAGTVETKQHGMFLLQRCEDGVMVRAFRGYRRYRKGNYRNPEQSWWEKRRIICSKMGIPLRTYHWGDYRRTEMRWLSSAEYNPYRYGYYYYYADPSSVPAGKVYGKTIPSLAKKELCFTGLPEAIKGMEKVDPEDYLDTLKHVPQLERLAKAGLFRLVQECIRDSSTKGAFRQAGESNLTKMLGIDNQELKRLRENKGGKAFLRWLQYEKVTGTILPDHVISWYCEENINSENLKFICDRMSVVQIYNYILRQMAENCMSSDEVLSTWSDYLAMAKRLKMDTDDAIIYRVRKLRQRHDELVERCHQKALALQAGEILQKYPHVEEIYETIREIYGYEGQDYTVQVPSCIEDILLEGQNLHHCVGSSDRYWDRIERQESYVLFLRRSADLQKPYYTLEIEPDGTVRQKRTMYDRQEADIEDATKFLRKWQKEISKRITEKERDLAEKSKELRAQEFVQMRQDQVIIHTGNLRGRLLVDVLMADLMENQEEKEAAVLQAAA